MDPFPCFRFPQVDGFTARMTACFSKSIMVWMLVSALLLGYAPSAYTAKAPDSLTVVGAGETASISGLSAPRLSPREVKILRKLETRYKHYPLETLYDVHSRKFVGLDRIFAFDDTPLGQRTPVILVPGRAEEFQPNSWWKKFHRLTTLQDKSFQKHFKLYVYIYDSRLPLQVLSEHFNRDMKHLFGTLPKAQQSVLVTYSLGGLITADALRNSQVLDNVHTIFALAVPFHGSPMFDPAWYDTYIRPPNRSPIRKFWDRFLYRAYMFDKTNLIDGLSWDNFDGSMPQFDAKSVNVHGDLVVIGPSPCVEDEYTRALKKKMIIYTSYLENGYTKSNQPLNPLRLPKYALEASAQLPRELVGTVLPAYGLTVHSVFTYHNSQLANIPTFTPEDPRGANTHLYRFNDGIIPLSSMLWLPKRAEPYDENLPGLVGALDVAKARVFVNLDHMHIGDYDGLRPSRIIAPDVLHPEDGKRKPNEWILYDIYELKPSLDDLKVRYPFPLEPEVMADDNGAMIPINLPMALPANER